MLQGIRDNSKGVIAKVIVGFIVITFALFGVESLVSLSQGSNAPASVNGEEISEAELYQATQLQRRSILARMGENADPSSLDDNLLSGLVLNSLIQEKALLINAEDSDMVVSDRMIDQIISDNPTFQVDGRFSVPQFDAVISSAGFTRLTYRESIRKEQLLNQQRIALSASSFVLPSTVSKIIELDRQTRNVRYASLPIETVRKLVSVSEEEVLAEFEKQKSSLNTVEQVELEYVELTLADIAESISVSEQEIMDDFEQVSAEFESQEQRQAAHILVEVNDDMSDSEALTKIKQIKQRLDQGESFAAVAKETSDDFGSADNGGDLGVVNKGTFEAGFEDELFALNEGEVSSPVESESGYHLIKALKITKLEGPSLEESRDEIIAKLTQRKAELIYTEKLEQLKDLAFISSDLKDISSELSLDIKTLPAFSQSGDENPLTQNTKLIRSAFSEELIQDSLNSEPIEIDRTRSIVIRVKEHFPVRAQTFDEVENVLKENLLTKKAGEQLEIRASKAIAEIKASGDASSLAVDFELKTINELSRVSADAPAEIINKAFELPHPEEGKVSVNTVTMADNSLAIVILDKINKAKTDDVTPQEVESVSHALSNRLGQQAYDVFVQEVNESAEVERL